MRLIAPVSRCYTDWICFACISQGNVHERTPLICPSASVAWPLFSLDTFFSATGRSAASPAWHSQLVAQPEYELSVSDPAKAQYRAEPSALLRITTCYCQQSVGAVNLARIRMLALNPVSEFGYWLIDEKVMSERVRADLPCASRTYAPENPHVSNNLILVANT